VYSSYLFGYKLGTVNEMGSKRLQRC